MQPNTVVDAVRALAPEIKARGSEIEAGRRTPPDLLDKLKATGVFRMLAPRSHGGLEVEFPRALDAIAAAARIDGSVGWTVMIGSASGILLSRLPKATFDEVYASGPDQIQAGQAGAPSGKAERVEGGYRVTGRWPFSSGCEHADWIIGLAVVTENGEPVPGAHQGIPAMKILARPASEWRIEDTWKVAGLKGTGSHHTALDDHFVPDSHAFELSGESSLPGAMYGATVPWLPLMHAAFAVGMAEGALEELVEMAGAGRQLQFAATPLKLSPVFHYELGRLEADVQAVRAMLQSAADRQWKRALDGKLREPASLPDSLQTAVWVTDMAVKIVDACFNFGGGSALYDASPLQRRLRDMHAGAQHAVVHRKNYELLGAGRMGIEGPPLA